MANEPSKIELLGPNRDGEGRRFACAAGTAITKYTLMGLTDARTAIAPTAAGQMLAGIAAFEKASTDTTSTSTTCWTQGVFDFLASGAITIGQKVMYAGGAGSNEVMLASTLASGAQVLGYALETASDNERINIRVDL